MASYQDQQVEKLLDQASKRGNFQDLEELLEDEMKLGITSKCSKQFISKLDKLINRELDHENVKHACLLLSIVHKLGDTLVFPRGDGLSELVSQGIVRKWFEKARKLWIEAGPVRNEMVVALAEDFFDALMAVHESCKEGTYQVTESLMHQIGKLVSNTKVSIQIQKEAVRKLNTILGKIPLELKKQKKILSSQEASSVMDDLAGQILKGGDYDLQVALMEALCRMTAQAQRRELADRWFTMEFVASAFSKIQDSEFETDCRKFLNLVNGMQADKRSVYSYPCLEVFLDKHVLLMPVDKNLKEFWIDFNLRSQSISFYFCLADQEGQWDTLCIAEHEIRSYSVQEEKGVQVLQLVLIEPVAIGNIEGSRLTIHFSSSLEILQAAKKVYGEVKHKKFVGKVFTSVAKTAVHIVSEEGDSQVLFSESQTPSQPVEKAAAPTSERNSTTGQPLAHQERDVQRVSQMTTPLRNKGSESCMYISGSAGRKLGKSPFYQVLPAVTTPAGKNKVKPPLTMVASTEKKKEYDLRELMMVKSDHNLHSFSENTQVTPAGKTADMQQGRKDRQKAEKHHRHIPVDKVVEMVQAENDLETEPLDSSIVPDSQPAMRKKIPILPGVTKRRISVSASLVSCQKELPQDQSRSDLNVPATVRVEITPQSSSAQLDPRVLSPRHLHAQLTQKLQQVLKQRKQQLQPCPAPQSGRRPSVARATVKVPGHGQPSQRPTPAKSTQNKQSKGVRSEDLKMTKEADNMVKQISNHYESSGFSKEAPRLENNKYFFRKSQCPTLDVKTAANNSCIQTSFNQTSSNKDVFTFGLDVPEVRVKKCRKSLEITEVESSDLSRSLSRTSSDKKCSAVKGTGRYVKKHLFSDTDAENTSDVSWLKSANKRKPKVVDYSRLPVKCTHPPSDATFETPNIPPPSPKAAKKLDKPERKRQRKAIDQMDNKKSNVVSRKPTGRPQRFAALAISYRELSESDSVSDADGPPSAKRSVLKQTEKSQGAATFRNQGRARNKNVTLPEVAIEQSVGEKSKPESKAGHNNAMQPCTSKMSSFCTTPCSTRDKRSSEKTASVFRSPVTPLDPPPQKPTVTPSAKPQKSAFVQPTGQIKRKRDRVSSDSVIAGPGKEKLKVVHMNTEKLNREITGLPQMTPQKPTKDQQGFTKYDSNFPLPLSIEKMRSNEKITGISKLPVTPLRSPSLSPIDATSPQPILPSHFREVQASSFYKTSGSSKPHSDTPRTRVVKKQSATGFQDPELSLLPSQPQPLLSSTGMENLSHSSLLNSPDPEENLEGFTKSRRCLQMSSDSESVISFVVLSQSSHRPVNSVSMLCAEVERTSACTQPCKNRKTDLESGPGSPCIRYSSCNFASLSDLDDGEDDEDKENKPEPRVLSCKMKPRKLFATSDKPQPSKKGTKQPLGEHVSSEEEEVEDEEEVEAMEHESTNATKKSYHNPHHRSPTAEVSTVEDMDTSVEADVDLTQSDMSTSQQMGYVCRQFSSELKRKIENRSRRMDLFTNQSLKTFRQHVSSICVQVHDCRSQKLEKVKRVLMDEIKSLEQDDAVLRNMEEDLNTYWKKQVLAFHGYREKGTQRLHRLKNVVETNVRHGLEHEEQIFSLQMGLMKKDMKSVQERFFRQMQEEELLSVRRGLQALFMSDVPML